jgi:hypothetical protein
MKQIYSIHLTLIAVLIIAIIILSIPIVNVNSIISNSQRIVVSSSHHVQNNSVIVLPNLEKEVSKSYISKYIDHTVKPSTSKTNLTRNNVSFTTTDSSLTVSKNILNGITKGDSTPSTQTIKPTSKEILHGKIL